MSTVQARHVRPEQRHFYLVCAAREFANKDITSDVNTVPGFDHVTVVTEIIGYVMSQVLALFHEGKWSPIKEHIVVR